MLFDENLTKTKAFKEQLEQHAVMFAPPPKRSPSFLVRLNTRVGERLNQLQVWVKTMIRTKLSFN